MKRCLGSPISPPPLSLPQDEAQFTFERAARAAAPRVAGLPVFGLGHSMGALAHCLIAARYSVERAGNVFLSFNNKPATDAIPLFAPVLSPLAQGLNPIITQWSVSPLKSGVERVQKQLRHGHADKRTNGLIWRHTDRNTHCAETPFLFCSIRTPSGSDASERFRHSTACFNSPSLALLHSIDRRESAPKRLRELFPLIDQLEPLTLDVAAGRTEFSPSPAETARLIRAYYGVRRNLLVRFKADTIDETPALAAVLQESAAAANLLELTLQARARGRVLSFSRLLCTCARA